MRRSKLELYVAVLNAVAVRGPLNITGLALRARLNYVQLKPLLNNLINKGAIQEQHLRNGSIVYAATSLGQRLSTQFKHADESKTALTNQAKQNMAAIII
jgi:predicted transcriptional regulator